MELRRENVSLLTHVDRITLAGAQTLNMVNEAQSNLQAVRIQLDHDHINIRQNLHNMLVMSYSLIYIYIMEPLLLILGDKFSNPENLLTFERIAENLIVENWEMLSRLINGDIPITYSNCEPLERLFINHFGTNFLENPNETLCYTTFRDGIGTGIKTTINNIQTERTLLPFTYENMAPFADKIKDYLLSNNSYSSVDLNLTVYDGQYLRAWKTPSLMAKSCMERDLQAWQSLYQKEILDVKLRFAQSEWIVSKVESAWYNRFIDSLRSHFGEEII
jgi:hypothetical protein